MYNRRVATALSLLFLAALLVLAGCSSKGKESGSESVANHDNQVQKDNKPQITTSPITLRMYHNGGSISDQEFKQYFADPVAKKYPNISMEIVRSDVQGGSPEDLLTSNSFPDIIYTAPKTMPVWINLGIIEDLGPYVKKNGMDLNRYQKSAKDGAMMGFEPDPGKLVSLPFSLNLATMIYNKDIFDKFGVAYPKDGMSWDDAIALGKKLTRTDAGINYIGIDPWRVEAVGSQLALPYYDPKTKKAAINNEGWASVLRIIKEVVDTPGYVNGKQIDYDFFKDNLAMYPIWASDLASKMTKPEVAKSRNWDLVTLPYVKGHEGMSRNTGVASLAISNLSKHKDEAFAVIQVAESDEVQLEMIKAGRISPLTDEKFKTNYMKGNPVFEGKNVASIFKMTPSPSPPDSKYDNDILKMVRGAKAKLALEQKDVNTVLREIQEQADQFIAANP
ncbi:MAG: family 1 extracellular solute-binding protein [Paenibacillaceae bacterium]|jgi:multiple sugar transport system substrate-binding protein|nr:family 1 extracellular solute-binding protein [Paenibacillaceae bacterium]